MYLNNIILGDCFYILDSFKENSIDAIITDPPYGLKFMGKKWDCEVPKVEIWEKCLRVLRPGGHLLCFAGTRTQHRMACNIEDAGFEIRDMIAWLYGSGFPKSLNLGKSVDKKNGIISKQIGESEREIMNYGLKNRCKDCGKPFFSANPCTCDRRYKPKTEDAINWEGYGTALKPALEPITLARKPISEKTITENVLKWKTGFINVDACRIEMSKQDFESYKEKRISFSGTVGKTYESHINIKSSPNTNIIQQKGRFPANIIHDGSEEVLNLFPYTKSGGLNKGHKKSSSGFNIYSHMKVGVVKRNYGNDEGSASRFFYCAKASKNERNEGYPQKNNHPTVKPIKLMEYLVKLITRENQIVLDPFGGSGTTGIACIRNDRDFVLIEKDENYHEICKERIQYHKNKKLMQDLNNKYKGNNND